MDDDAPLVPYAGTQAARFFADDLARSAMRGVGDRLVRMAEDICGDDLDARLARSRRRDQPPSSIRKNRRT